MRLIALLACLALASPAFAQDEGADQVVGLFGATCVHFAGDAAGLRGFLTSQGAPPMPAQARDAFLAGRHGQVFDTSYQAVKLATISLDDGGCEAVVERADPSQIVAMLNQAAAAEHLTLTPLPLPPDPKRRAGVQQTAYVVTLGGKPMHIMVSTAPAPPNAVLSLVPR